MQVRRFQGLGLPGLVLLVGCPFIGEKDLTDRVDRDGDGYGVGYGPDADCDDNNSAVHPGAEEICDSVDNNCSGEVDEGVMQTFHVDSDGDEYGHEFLTVEACAIGAGYVEDASDCDDEDPLVNPGAEEVCDGTDNDCDESTPDGEVSITFHQDLDGDGHGDPNVFQSGCDRSLLDQGWTQEEFADDCDDTDSTIHPGAEEICGDGIDQDCDGGPGDCVLKGTLGLEDSDVILTRPTRADYSGLHFGLDVKLAGDVDGDGHLDLLIAAPNPAKYANHSNDLSSPINNDETSGAFLVYGPFAGSREMGTGGQRTAALLGTVEMTWGLSVAAPGDLDGDGLDDILVGAPSAARSSVGSNIVAYVGAPVGVFGSTDGHGFAAWTSASTSTLVGWYLSEPGDLDGDGVGDVLAGDPDWSSASSNLEASGSETECTGTDSWYHCGAVRFFSGADFVESGASDFGAVPIASVFGPFSYEGFGEVVEPAGDLDGDGFGEFLVSAPRAKNSESDTRRAGRVYVLPGDMDFSSNQNGGDLAIATVTGDDNYDALGTSISALGDLDQDGYGDFGIGVPGVSLFSGGVVSTTLPEKNGSVVVFRGPVSGSYDGVHADLVLQGEALPGMAGTSLGSGDLDGDGWTDVAVGAKEHSTSGLLSGAVYVYYAPMLNGQVPFQLDEADAVLEGESHGDLAGISLAIAPDMNGDGGDDLVVGAIGVGGTINDVEGAVYVAYSGSL